MNKAVTSNALWLIFGRVVQMGIQLVMGVLTARYLGPSDYGLIQYAAAYTGFFAAFCSLGLPSTLVRELTEAPEAEGEILGTAVALQVIAGIMSAAAILLVISATDGDVPGIRAVAALSCVGLLLRSFEVFRSWFLFRAQSKAAALATLTACCITAGGKLYLLAAGKPVAWFALAGAAEQCLSAEFLQWAYRRNGGRPLRISRETGRRLLRRSGHFILPGVLAAVYAQTDKLMLGRMLGEAAVGHYSAAASVSGGWCFVLSAIIDSIWPEITKAWNQEKKLFFRRNRQLYALVFYLSCEVSLVLCLGAEVLMPLLFGASFRPAVAVLRILTWNTAFSYLGVARNAWVVCRNVQKHLVWIYGAAAVTNVALNLLLIPRWGVAGAAAASVAAQIVTTFVVPLFLKPLRENVGLMTQAIALRGVFGEKKV